MGIAYNARAYKQLAVHNLGSVRRDDKLANNVIAATARHRKDGNIRIPVARGQIDSKLWRFLLKSRLFLKGKADANFVKSVNEQKMDMGKII